MGWSPFSRARGTAAYALWKRLPIKTACAMLCTGPAADEGFWKANPETLAIRYPSYVKPHGDERGSAVSRGWLAFMWAVIGAVVGQLIGAALADYVPLLNYHLPLGLAPATLDLNFLVVTFGISFKLTIAGAIGLVLALWLALR